MALQLLKDTHDQSDQKLFTADPSPQPNMGCKKSRPSQHPSNKISRATTIISSLHLWPAPLPKSLGLSKSGKPRSIFGWSQGMLIIHKMMGKYFLDTAKFAYYIYDNVYTLPEESPISLQTTAVTRLHERDKHGLKLTEPLAREMAIDLNLLRTNSHRHKRWLCITMSIYPGAEEETRFLEIATHHEYWLHSTFLQEVG